MKKNYKESTRRRKARETALEIIDFDSTCHDNVMAGKGLVNMVCSPLGYTSRAAWAVLLEVAYSWIEDGDYRNSVPFSYGDTEFWNDVLGRIKKAGVSTETVQWLEDRIGRDQRETPYDCFL